MSTADDLATLQANNAADAAALTALEADLNSTAPSVGDNVLSAVVSTLEAAGYTVTPPAQAAAAASDSTDASASDSTSGDTSGDPSASQ